MRVLSLYDGISCGQEAIKRIGIEVSEYYACEIEKHAVAITQHNFPNTIQLGNVFDVDFSSLGEFDLVIGGSPCTFWSISKRDRETTSEGMGFDLFMQFVYAVKQTKAKYFLYENNFSIHKDIKDAITDKLGVGHVMIDSALLSGQRRKRCYWFGKVVNGKATTVDVEQPQDKGILLQDILEDEVDSKYFVKASSIPRYATNGKPKGLCTDKSKTLTASMHKGYGNDGCTVIAPVRVGQYGNGGQGQRIYSTEGKSVNLTANGGGQGAKTGLYEIDYNNIRRLTPLEAERLQTLPDNFTKYGIYDGAKKEVADTNRLRAIGNGWTVEVIAHILEQMV
jgi:DNA (cytosine-5)-methyltransferase 3A